MENDSGRDDFRPKKRSGLRLAAGRAYYTLKRYMLWYSMGKSFACDRGDLSRDFLLFEHRTPLRRSLRGEELRYQEGKIKNLKIAVPRLDGLLLRPGEVLSYWRLIGKPTTAKGYAEGMVLTGGEIGPGVGGGLCQLSNLIFWMTLHTPLTVIERYRHGYDVFPDSSRTQPFGSGATCSYPYLDLMIRNDTDASFKLHVFMDGDYLRGEWHADAEPIHHYEIIERNHEMRGEPFGGFSRHNELWRLVRDSHGEIIKEEKVAENHAMMTYSPLLEDN